MRSAFALFLLLIFSLPLLAASKEQLALEEINQAREMAGLSRLSLRKELNIAAQAHADYISKNNALSHTQNPKKPHFTGVAPKDRAIAAGYQSRFVKEMFFVGPEGLTGAVESLFSAIYHRLGFLDFSLNELGYGQQKNKENGSNVFVMGNKELEEICQDKTLKVKKKYYFDICKGSRKTPAKPLDRAKARQYKKQPTYVLWPPEGSRFVPPGFFDEVPDPVPDKMVTGYPLSIQLNPYYFKRPKLISFKLYQAGAKEVLATRILSQSTDPNQQLSPLEFALFPLYRLDWGASYQAEVNLKEGGKSYQIRWGFYTKKAPQPFRQIEGKGEKIQITGGQSHYLYLPPTESRPVIESLNWSQPKGVTLKVDFYDKNTIKIMLDGRSCKGVHINLPPFRGFYVQISPDSLSKACQ